jgi:hypothetical protein
LPINLLASQYVNLLSIPTGFNNPKIPSTPHIMGGIQNYNEKGYAGFCWF